MNLSEKIQTFFRNQNNAGFFGDRFILLTGLAGIVINAGLWWYLRYSLDPKESFITLHFTVASGVDLVGKASEIYNLPYYAAIFSFLNILIPQFYQIPLWYYQPLFYPLNHSTPGIVPFLSHF